MKQAILGIVALMSLSSPALAQRDAYHRQTWYFDENHRYVGRYVIYCDGRELEEGQVTQYTEIYLGTCDAV